MHTGHGFKIPSSGTAGEGTQSRSNLLTTMKDDYVEVCLRMIEGTLRKIDFVARPRSLLAWSKAYGAGFDSSKTESAVDLGPAENSTRCATE